MAGKDYKLTLVMIGPKNVGKTVFLSALANSPGIGIGDPASVRAIKLHWEALSKGELPSATAATLASLLFSYSGKIGENSYNVDLRIPDYDGHFAEIMSEYETGAREIGDLRALIKQADGFVVFMPADSRPPWKSSGWRSAALLILCGRNTAIRPGLRGRLSLR